MLKDGTRHFQQDNDNHSASVVLRNIDACLQLCRMVRTSYGPQGRCKLVVNHLEKISVTSDCAAILKDMEIEHPAAQLIKYAAVKQQEECGDATNLVLAFAGELLYQTSVLISKMTFQPAPEILAGYRMALQICEDTLPHLVCDTTGTDILSDRVQLMKILRPVLASKQYGSQDGLAALVADACLSVRSSDDGPNPNANTTIQPESIRTVKILGGSIMQSCVMTGFVAQRGVETVTQCAMDAKIAVFACAFEASSTEAKGTVLMKTADDLKNYNRSEERKLQEIVESMASVGITVVVTGGNVSDMALHFLDRSNMMCVKLGSKWELRRLCQAIGATALVRLGPPMPEEMGHANVNVQVIGGKTVTVFDSKSESKLATIVLRASTMSVLNDVERAVDDGVQAVAQAGKDGRLVYGGGACEMALSVTLQQEAAKVSGLEQYAIEAFGKALQVIPRTLAENAGWDAARVVADMQAAHSTTGHFSPNGGGIVCDVGVNVEHDNDRMGGTTGMKAKGVVDLLATKLSALRLAVDAAVTILKVDQIIMSKPSGGPKM